MTLEQINTTISQLKSEIENNSKKIKNYDQVNNEGFEGYNPYEAACADLQNQIERLQDQRFDLEWTKEITIERRQAWNKWVKSHKKISNQQIHNQCAAQGWTHLDLASAVKKHAL